MSDEIDVDMVRHIGKLSRIELTDEEVPKFARQLGDVLGHFGKLRELDTEGVEPMAHAVELNNVLGDDVPGESLSPEEALANAPQRDGDFFKVPKVIGDSS
ncbi:MAG TPA: Asp-tRNA(Asn)/Glu-tRNA(Gln) amidotransferase subunit GatC [Phycisphaerae bacterium]|nr:Asp-tRNA(Asn)/Glu-tRNA(Gln) amidotransferase subunit GatC [Phycisphaerae bacterium]